MSTPKDSNRSIWIATSVFDGWKAFLWFGAFVALMAGVLVPGVTEGDWSGALWGGVAGALVLVAILIPNRVFE